MYISFSIVCTFFTRTTTGSKCNGFQRLILISKRRSGVQKGVFFFLTLFFFLPRYIPNIRTLFNETTISLADSLFSPFLHMYVCVFRNFYCILCISIFSSQFENHPARIDIPRATTIWQLLFVCSLKRKLFSFLFFPLKILRTQNCLSRRNFLYPYFIILCAFLFRK